MPDEAKMNDRPGVDSGLIAMFLRMSPEERLRVNDDALCAILELRDAYRRKKASQCKPK